jgi:ZIP family zinc transporter
VLPIILTISTFVSTFCGGLFALHYQKYLRHILGYAAGIIIGVIAFDILPEIFELVRTANVDATVPMVALVVGFLLFHIMEKTLLIHHEHESRYGKHHHPHVGLLSALALSGHSFLDGVGIGLGFQVNSRVGIAVAIAVIAHDFADGLNTVGLMLAHKNSARRALKMLIANATLPVLGVLASRFLHFNDTELLLYLGFFAGFLLYIGASDILPQAHDEKSSRLTILLTIFGAAVMFLITYLVEIIEIIGWYGSIAIILAYALMSFKVISSDDAIYQLLNLTGALGIITVSLKKRVHQSVVLNTFWAVIAAVALVNIFI